MYPKWASDARHMVVAGPVRNLAPDRADIWLGQFAADFNSIAKWVHGIFWLLQEKDKLLVGLSRQGGDAKPEVFEMATLPDTRPHHVIVSIAAKRLAFYLDGRKVKELDPSFASFIAAKPPPMSFAACHTDPGKNTWRGTFEYVAMYSRFIEEDEAAKNAAVVAADLARRKTLPRIEVQATLIAKSKIPDRNETIKGTAPPHNLWVGKTKDSPQRHGAVVSLHQIIRG